MRNINFIIFLLKFKNNKFQRLYVFSPFLITWVVGRSCLLGEKKFGKNKVDKGNGDGSVTNPPT